MSQRRTYRIVIRGELSDRFEAAFDDMSLERREGNTVLVGDIVDQAHLHGLIEQIQALGFELLSVNPVEDLANRS